MASQQEKAQIVLWYAEHKSVITVKECFEQFIKEIHPMLRALKSGKKRFSKLKVYRKDPEVIGVHFLMQVWKIFDKLSFGALDSPSGRQLLNYLCHDQLFRMCFIEN
ncbi:hypothetical protein AVEN_63456-1 [Araneus ventricosus]|uniref:Uncharacterized protein n=1 Tax=Araneus ventricosus TaxID=182803 RepID=A0A4Y2CS98_ARAVE|nr:hypothetical protein AVEN_63456-1 [Araneus ventricosus]